ncbi:MAG: hypothetical protein AB7F86_06290 [Bdellovibrionales bacterium]
MSNLGHDPLYQVFEEHLHSGLYDDKPTEIFVRDVVDYFVKNLSQEGYVPLRMQDLLRADLNHDVNDMLRTKIYGHYDIGQYNRNRRGQEPS